MVADIVPMAEVVLIRDFDISRNCGTVVEKDGDGPMTVEKGSRIFFKPGACTVITAAADGQGLVMAGDVLAVARPEHPAGSR